MNIGRKDEYTEETLCRAGRERDCPHLRGELVVPAVEDGQAVLLLAADGVRQRKCAVTLGAAEWRTRTPSNYRIACDCAQRRGVWAVEGVHVHVGVGQEAQAHDASALAQLRRLA